MGQIILLVLAVFAAIVEVMVAGNRWLKMEYFDSRHHAVFRLDYQHRSWLTVLPALLVGLGASSFAASDTLLAWNKFVMRLRYRRQLLTITYHVGQFAIMLGAALQFS